jgi:transcriptional regulator with XRE-family HTH domain
MDLHVAARLRRRRLLLQLEPELLNLAIGEQPGTIERVERGDKRLGAGQLYRIATVLGVDVSYFFAAGLEKSEVEPDEPPETDPKALSEAKRFARAYSRIADSTVRKTIRDLLTTLAEDDGSTMLDALDEGPSEGKRKTAP